MSEMLNTDLLVARLEQAERERDEARGQLEKVSPLVSAVHRILTVLGLESDTESGSPRALSVPVGREGRE